MFQFGRDISAWRRCFSFAEVFQLGGGVSAWRGGCFSLAKLFQLVDRAGGRGDPMEAVRHDRSRFVKGVPGDV